MESKTCTTAQHAIVNGCSYAEREHSSIESATYGSVKTKGKREDLSMITCDVGPKSQDQTKSPVVNE